MLVVRNVLFGDIEMFGRLFVFPAEHEEQLDALEPFKFTSLPPLCDQRLQRLSQDRTFSRLSLLTTKQTGRSSI